MDVMRSLSRFRYVTAIAVVFSLLGSFLMFYIGGSLTVKAYAIVFWDAQLDVDVPEHLDQSDQAIIALVKSIDAFMIALVFFVLALGIFALFIGDIEDNRQLSWMRFSSLEDFKKVMVEMVIVVIVVLFLSVALYESEQLEWKLLILPASVVLLSISLKMVGWHRSE